jgi:hypothetical protein
VTVVAVNTGTLALYDVLPREGGALASDLLAETGARAGHHALATSVYPRVTTGSHDDNRRLTLWLSERCTPPECMCPPHSLVSRQCDVDGKGLLAILTG